MKRCIINALLIFAFIAASAQEYITPVKSDVMPPTPQSWQPISYQMPQPATLTGAVDLSIPIYTITAGDFSLPIYMQYHSNGIKVTDDPRPYGYGWSLMPAFRATRTIMGRPDELFPFVPKCPVTPLENLLCAGTYAAISSFNGTEYDYQHDIITFSLPGKTITAILDFSSGSPMFVSAMADEYKISADDELDEIELIDPHGIKYIFGGPNESQPMDDYAPGLYKTAWALNQIEINAGESISIEWGIFKSDYADPFLIGGYSFMDSWHSYAWQGLGVELDQFINDVGLTANFSRYAFCNDVLGLKSITFPGGKLTLSRAKTVNSISVSNGDEIVKTVDFSYDKTRLKSLTLSDEGEYLFDYDSVDFTTNSGQDWWGFYNGTTVFSHTPRMRLRRYNHCDDKVGIFLPLGESDRSPDSQHMTANMLTKVTYPTGGYSAFRYEPHQFDSMRAEEGANDIYPEDNPYLNMGGGVRVSEITMATGPDDADSLVVKYDYSNPVVRAVPSASTFIDVCKACYDMTGLPDSRYSYDILRSVHVNINSNYMRYDNGAIPIWYQNVTATFPEGKIEYKHKFVLPADNDINREFGCRYLISLNRACSSGIQLVEKITYKGTPSQYCKVESERYDYDHVQGRTIWNYSITRLFQLCGGRPSLHLSVRLPSRSWPLWHHSEFHGLPPTRRYSLLPFLPQSHPIKSPLRDNDQKFPQWGKSAH